MNGRASRCTIDGAMRAVVQRAYGAPSVLGVADVAVPAIGAEDVLVRVHAAGLSYPDHVFTAGVPYVVRAMFGLRRPRQAIRGQEVSGIVSAVGSQVSDLEVDDAVFGWCADRHGGGGGFAEYARCRRAYVRLKPDGMAFTEAACLPVSGVTALQAVRDWAAVKPGQRVLINGAAGGVGSFAVQVAKTLGAEVTGVCGPQGVALVRSLGADAVIDYTVDDFTRGPRRYDAIVDLPHYAGHTLGELRRVLASDGVLVPASNTANRWLGGFSRVVPARLLAPFVSQRIRAPEMVPNEADLVALAELVTAGKVRPVIAGTYALADVPDAMRRFEQGHTHGKIVIIV
jgi:NADPH:quinone reductase-like Zn-dependent oxidoreductase